jgi:ParB-like chromosome segregation protein Spo0J
MNDQELLEKLAEYPDLKARIKEMLMIVENPGEEVKRADDAEERVIEITRGIGHDLLQNWANRRAAQAAKQMEQSVKSAKKNVKKSLLA